MEDKVLQSYGIERPKLENPTSNGRLDDVDYSRAFTYLKRLIAEGEKSDDPLLRMVLLAEVNSFRKGLPIIDNLEIMSGIFAITYSELPLEQPN